MQTRIAGVAVLDAVFSVASGIVTVLPDWAATRTESVAGILCGLSQVIKSQLQVASTTVTRRSSVMPGWLGYEGSVVLNLSERALPVTRLSRIGSAFSL